MFLLFMLLLLLFFSFLFKIFFTIDDPSEGISFTISFLYHHLPTSGAALKCLPLSSVDALHCASFFGRLSGAEEAAWVISGRLGEMCHPHFPLTDLGAGLCSVWVLLRAVFLFSASVLLHMPAIFPRSFAG